MKGVILTLTTAVIISVIIVIPVFAQTNQTTDLQQNMPESTTGNITTPIAPQGTSIEVANDTSTSDNVTASTSGNITTPIAPG
jgi:hypothetical protein